MGASQTLTLANVPFEGLQRCLLHRVTNDCAVIELHQRMRSREAKRRRSVCLFDVNELFAILRTASMSKPMSGYAVKRHALNASHTFEYEVLGRDRAGLVETANVDAACERDPEGLRAEHSDLGERNKRRVHRKRELHRQLWRYHARHDQDAVKQQLALLQPALNA
jgi:hypothetical protein